MHDYDRIRNDSNNILINSIDYNIRDNDDGVLFAPIGMESEFFLPELTPTPPPPPSCYNEKTVIVNYVDVNLNDNNNSNNINNTWQEIEHSTKLNLVNAQINIGNIGNIGNVNNDNKFDDNGYNININCRSLVNNNLIDGNIDKYKSKHNYSDRALSNMKIAINNSVNSCDMIHNNNNNNNNNNYTNYYEATANRNQSHGIRARSSPLNDNIYTSRSFATMEISANINNHD